MNIVEIMGKVAGLFLQGALFVLVAFTIFWPLIAGFLGLLWLAGVLA